MTRIMTWMGQKGFLRSLEVSGSRLNYVNLQYIYMYSY